MDGSRCIQELYAPNNACFGCGPANPKGLRVRSFFGDGIFTAEWKAEEHHEAFPGVLSGGIIGTLLDCHSNWAAAYALMEQAGDDRPPCTVTAQYSITLRRPCPTNGAVSLRAKVLSREADRCSVEATLEAGGKICATCAGTFVAVKPGHPAYHRW